jgi:type IV fimbrial biogenesis protein FimT
VRRCVHVDQRQHSARAGGVNVIANVASMRFDQTNGTVSPAGTIRVATNGSEVRHVVNIMGRVRSCSPGGSAKGYIVC